MRLSPTVLYSYCLKHRVCCASNVNTSHQLLQLAVFHLCFPSAVTVLSTYYTGVVFRDLKPEAITVAANGYLKLADFSFAKQVPTSSRD